VRPRQRSKQDALSFDRAFNAVRETDRHYRATKFRRNKNPTLLNESSFEVQIQRL
jgi:hypothetical protein